MLQGGKVNLRVVEREDVDFLVDSVNDVDYGCEYEPISQTSRSEVLRKFENPSQVALVCERQRFIIEKKDRKKVGAIAHWIVQPERFMEIGYVIIPSERGKGYGSEAVQLMVDYLFLSKDIARVQALTDVRNKPSQRVLEKAGFQREGLLRKTGLTRGVWTDAYMYSVIREEWEEPKILTKNKENR